MCLTNKYKIIPNKGGHLSKDRVWLEIAKNLNQGKTHE